MRPGRVIATAGVVALCLAALELSPYLLASAVTGEGFSRSALQAALADTTGTYGEGVGDAGTEEYLGDHLLHPYFGFNSVPRKDRNRFGLPGADPLMRPAPDTVNVCIAGGSVAMGLLTHSTAALQQALQADAAYRGKVFRFTAFALGGFKQPQPLEALAWFLAQGAHYDLVIALDGFNEVVLPWCDNRPFGVWPSYPRHWNMYARKRVDNRVLRAAAEQLRAREAREQLRKRFRRVPWRWSNAALLVWRVLDGKERHALQLAEQQAQLALAESERNVQATGPGSGPADTLAFLNEAVELWAHSSVLMRDLVLARGGRYAHFLQPNQYVEGSKPLTREERALAIEPGPFCYRDAVHLAYPLLRTRGEQLREAGIPFTDLTLLFTNETRTVYSDKCCHFNKAGYDRIAEAIAAALRSS